jgi:RNA polymerase sigma factor (sigma-70 family)
MASGVSLLAHYHGRSRLITWLRSVLVQRHIDRVRATRRLEPLDDEGTGASSQAAIVPDPDPERDTLIGHAQRALDAGIDALEAKDRLRLRLYYGQDMTLAAIGRVLGEHEATVSRKLDRRVARCDRKWSARWPHRGWPQPPSRALSSWPPARQTCSWTGCCAE